MKTIRIAILALLVVSTARTQQYTVCNPGTSPGQIICQNEPTASGKRLAIVGAAIVGGVVVALVIHRHHTHKTLKQSPAPTEGQSKKEEGK